MVHLETVCTRVLKQALTEKKDTEKLNSRSTQMKLNIVY